MDRLESRLHQVKTWLKSFQLDWFCDCAMPVCVTALWTDW